MRVNDKKWNDNPLVFACHYDNTKERDCFLKWCHDNISDPHTWEYKTPVNGMVSDGERWGMIEMIFTDEADAMAFKLRWM